MSLIHDKYNIIQICIIYTVTSNIYVSSVTNDTTYFQTRQLSGQQYGLDYNLQNHSKYEEKIADRSRTLFDWNSPRVLSKEEIKVQSKRIDANLETERVENNVWWPWKNYDDWLNGRGLKSEPKKPEKKIRKEKKHKKKNRKNEKKKEEVETW